MYKNIEEIFKRSLNYDIQNVELIGGMTNVNFLVTSSMGQFVVRIPGPQSNLMIARTNEKFNQNLACQFDFNVPTIFFDEETGIKITKFIKNAITLKPYTVIKYLDIIAPFLKKLHQSNMLFRNRFNPFEEMHKYLSLIKPSDLHILPNFKDAITLFFEFEDKITSINNSVYGKDIVLAPTHGDLVPENILFCNDRLYIIDWEYSGLNDPCWDIASLFVEMGANSNENLEYSFLKCYGIKDEEVPKITIYKSVQDILWTAWSLAKISSGVDYYDYAKTRLESALNRKNI